MLGNWLHAHKGTVGTREGCPYCLGHLAQMGKVTQELRNRLQAVDLLGFLAHDLLTEQGVVAG